MTDTSVDRRWPRIRYALGLGLFVAMVELIAVVTFFSGFRVLKLHFASRSWKSTQATVIETRDENVTQKSGVTRREIVIRYQYSVDGQIFSNSRIYFNMLDFDNNDIAGELARRHTPGTNVAILYSPDDPTQATLTRTMVGPVWPFTIGGFFFIIVGLWPLLDTLLPIVKARFSRRAPSTRA